MSSTCDSCGCVPCACPDEWEIEYEDYIAQAEREHDRAMREEHDRLYGDLELSGEEPHPSHPGPCGINCDYWTDTFHHDGDCGGRR